MKHIKVLLLSMLCLWIGINTLYAQDTGNGVLPGKFSISANDTVCFSQGNLQCKKDAEGSYEWRFAKEQYERLDTLNNNIGKPGAWFDLFGYGTSGGVVSGYRYYLPEQTSRNSGDAVIYNWLDFGIFILRCVNCILNPSGCDITLRPDYATSPLNGSFRSLDWGINKITNGGNEANVWHSLTSTQWNYLINRRANANVLKKFTTIQTTGYGNVYGLLLLPDDSTSVTVSSTLSESAWKSLEAKGAVFLPTAGLRVDSTYYHRTYNQSWQYTGPYKGFYWTASCSNYSRGWFSYSTVNPDAIHFDEGGSTPIEIDHDFANFFGFSVRMARRIGIPVTFKYNNGIDKDTTIYVNYGDRVPSVPTPHAKKEGCTEYPFVDWGFGVSLSGQVFEATTYTARYSSRGTTKSYTVTFYNWDGTTYRAERNVQCNYIPQNPGAPVKNQDCDSTYTFTGWIPSEFAEAQNCTAYYATFSGTAKKYRVSWQNWDGEELHYDSLENGNAISIPSIPTPERTSQDSIYTFKGWSPNPADTAVSCSDVVITAVFESKPRFYEITWKDYNDTTLRVDSVEYDKTPEYGDDPVRLKDCRYTYEFAQWNPEVVTTVGDATYTAQYEPTDRTYPVTWYDYKGDVLLPETLECDNRLIYSYDDPEKPTDNDSVYFFDHWASSELYGTSIDGEYDSYEFHPVFTSVPRWYKITYSYLDENEKVWKSDTARVEYNSTLDFDTIEDTRVYCDSTYTFTGWNPELETVTDKSNHEYTAVYESSVNKYDMKWVALDTTITNSQNYDSLLIVPEATDSVWQADSIYLFQSWDPTPESLGNKVPCQDTTFTAQYKPISRYYKVYYSYLDEEEKVWKTDSANVEFGKTLNFDTVAVTRVYCDSTYTFEGWTPDLETVTDASNYVYTAVYSSDANTYDVTWLNWNDTVVFKETLEYNVKVNAPLNPEKTASNDTVYFFDGWTPEPALTMPCEDVVYKATFLSRARHYKDTIILHDTTIVVDVEFDSVPKLDSLSGEVEHCDSTYTFDHWSPQVRKHDTVPMTYVAVYKAVPTMHTVTWKNWNGSVRYTEDYELGKTIKMPTPDPTRPTNGSNVYFFTGWSPVPSTMPCEDLVFEPQFDARARYYYDSIIRHDDTVVVEAEYGKKPYINSYKDTVVHCDSTYEWIGWEPADTTQDTVAIKFVAVYKATVNTYPVTWYDGDGSVIESTSYEYDALIRRPLVIPTKATEGGNVYFFTGWSPEPATNMPCEELVYTPMFDNKQQYYYDTIVRHDDTIPISVAYDSVPNLDKYKDTVVHCDSIYKFREWLPSDTTQDTVAIKFVALYDVEVNTHNVTWKNWDGKVIYAKPLELDSAIVVPTPNPTRPTDTVNVYFFAGWNPEPKSYMPCNDETYTAQYTAKSRYYKDTVLILDEETNEYDTFYYSGEYDSVPDLKDYEQTIVHCDSIYTFAGWTPAVGAHGTEPVKYTATYTSSVNKHNVTWKNWDNSVIYSEALNYDSAVAYDLTYGEPKHLAGVSKVYFFDGWTPEVVTPMPCEDKTYTAKFIEKSRHYKDTVLILNEETNEYDTFYYSGEYDSVPDLKIYEKTIVHCDSVYTFAGWTPAVGAHDTVPAKYTATYTSTPNTHTVTWKNWDGSVIDSKTLELDADVVVPADPTRPTEEANVYFFAGWDPEPVATMPCNDLTYTAKYTVKDRYYTDSLVLKDTTVALIVDYDSVPDLSGYTQTVVHCDSTYEFLRWSPKVAAQDTVYVEYVAEYIPRVNKHTVTWLNWDSTIVKTDAVNYDSVVKVPVTIPTKPSTSSEVYFFTGWTPEFVEGTTMPCEDLTYKATFEAKNRYYEDTIVCLDTTIYVAVEYKTIPRLDTLRDTILRCDTLYEWVAWAPTVGVQDTTPVKYTAVYRKTPVTHNVTWKNWNGSILYSEALELNEPIYAPADPSRPTDDNFVYFFNGWNPTPATLMPCNDEVYNAQYIVKSRYYQDTIVRLDDTVYVTVEYGKTPVIDTLVDAPVHCDSIYEWIGWNPALEAQDTTPAKYKAIYRAKPNTHSVTWQNWDGQVIYAEALEFDSLIKQPMVIPTKPTEGGKVYFFTGWDPEPAEYMPCNDVVYTAQFDDKQQYYYDTVVRFRDKILVPVAYDSVPNIDKYKDSITLCDSIYEWIAWNPAPAAQDTVAVKYEAVYSARVNQHSVTWQNWDGTELLVESFDYDSLINQYKGIPTRPTVGGKVYFFTGWNPEPAEYMPCNDVVYTAQFTDEEQYYYDTVYTRTDTFFVPVAYDSVPNIDMYKDTVVECDSIYEWIGWTPTPSAQGIAAVAYTSVYNARINYHSATWKNWDGQVFLTEAYEYDSVVTAPNIVPTRPMAGGKVYFFSGWNPVPTTMQCNDMVFTAQFTERQQYYQDTVVRLNDTVYTNPVEFGTVPNLDSYKDTIYACDSIYEWIGWNPTPSAQDTTPAKYTAVYGSRINRYDITWLNANGSLVKSETLDYGADVTVPAATPTMPSTPSEAYVFSGWYPTPVATMPCDDLVYVAQYDTIPVYGDVIVHTMTGDATVIVALGQTPDLSQYAVNVNRCDSLFVFDHWTPNVTPKVPGDVEYWAVYQSFPKSYNVTWKNGADTVTTTLVGFNMPIQVPFGIPTPTRPATQDSIYTFSGWSMIPGTLMGCGDTVFYATYTSASAYIPNPIVLKDTVVLDTVPYDSLPNLDAYTETVVHCDYTYTFREWSPAIQPQGANPVTYTALYDSVQNVYTVAWVNGEDTVYDYLHCGDIPSIADPAKDADCDKGYVFNGWTPAIVPVTGNIVYKATYLDTVRYYQISLFDYDSTYLRTVALQCGETLNDTCVLREGNDTINYRFTGWDRTVTPADRDTSYYAVYESEERVIYYDATLSYIKCTGDTLTLPSGSVINVLADGSVNDTVYHAARKPYEGMDCYNNDSLVDMTVYTITFANYKNPLEGALNIACVDEVVQGMPIDLTQTMSDVISYFVGNDDELIPDWDNSEWQMLDGNGNWVAYTGADIRDHEIGDTVYMRLFIPTNCDDIYFSLNANGCDMSVHQANADNCPDCQNDTAVIAVYDWLLMYEHARMQSEGYNVTPDKVYWYAIGGDDWDNLNDWTIPYALDDEYLGNGYYYTINQAFNGTGDYYALVDVTDAGARTLPCLGIMRSQKFHYAYAPANAPTAQLYPSEVRNSDVVYVVGLQSGVKNDIYVYDMRGQLVSHDTVTEDHYEFHAAGAAGTYRVVVITENNKQTLSFIIL